MKHIEIDDEIYAYIASNTICIGESASDILRRLLAIEKNATIEKPLDISILPQNMSQLPLNETVQLKQNELLPQVPPTKDLSSELIELLISNKFKALSTSIQRFLEILSVLHKSNTTNFVNAVTRWASSQQKTKSRVYFAESPEVLLASGKTTKPKPIPATPYWVITNNNTQRKRYIVEHLMKHMNYSMELIETVTNAI